MKKTGLILLCALLLLCTALPYTGAAAGKTDTDNHMACDNANYKIPTGKPVRLDSSNGWERSEENLLTKFYSMYQPEVIYVPEWDTEDGYPYIMWFFAWSYNQENDPQGEYPGYAGGDSTFAARAKDINGPWEVYSKDYKTGENYWDTTMTPYYWYPVIECQDTWYDSWHVGDPSVVYAGGVFYMAYSSMGCDVDMIPSHKQGDTDGNASCIMGATSTDGINWTLSEKPLIIWSNEKGYDEKNYLPEYLGGHQRPSLMLENGMWKMWYDYRYNQIGYAECTGDFMTGTWKETATGKNGLLNGVDFDVVKIGDIYYAYGDPYVDWVGVKDTDIPYYSDDQSKWSQRQIVEYQSYDGLNWTPTGYFLPDTGYDANQIPQVFLDHKDNRVYIFYATQRGKKFSSYYDWRWDNIRCMSRDINLFALDIKNVNITTASPSASPTVVITKTLTPQPSGTSPTAAPSAAAGVSDKNSGWPLIMFIACCAVAAGIVAAALIIRKNRSKG